MHIAHRDQIEPFHHIRNLGDKEVIQLVTCALAWTPGCEVGV
jgi:hypothetical protein